MTDLAKRLTTGSIIAVLALFGIWSGGIVFFLLLVTVCGLAAVEWSQMTSGNRLVPALTALIGVAAVFGAWFMGSPIGALILMAGTFAAAYVAGGIGSTGAHRLMAAVGPVYVGLAGLSLLWMRESGTAGLANVMLVMLCVWATDIGAYFTGRSIGGPKLAPRISPKKTWSGLAGGITSAMAAGFLVSAVFSGASVAVLLVFGAGLAVVAQTGDLLESALKRHFGIKDSGRLLPGHGGVLDRIDGLLTAAPVTAVFLLLYGSDRLWS